MHFLVFHFSFWCSSVFSLVWQLEASVSMGSNMSFLRGVLILELNLFFPVSYHVSAHQEGESL